MLLGLCLAMAVGAMIPLRVSGAGNDAAMLKRIASRVDGRMGVIAIEATTPVPCIASQPDPKTFVVELRDVVAVGFQNEFSADPRNPIASVQVEHAAANDGTIVARVRMNLDQPMRPRVPQFAERHLRRGRESGGRGDSGSHSDCCANTGRRARTGGGHARRQPRLLRSVHLLQLLPWSRP